jgi:hypothetical protein
MELLAGRVSTDEEIPGVKASKQIAIGIRSADLVDDP